ncbi:hypothetical protein R1flu_008466 [Riccia fluitans]|uniref:Uncharacterized protein n=1 Tax=Riccia fluitans TaxID=41844 RepID=A0ABD1YBT5_9MARC
MISELKTEADVEASECHKREAAGSRTSTGVLANERDANGSMAESSLVEPSANGQGSEEGKRRSSLKLLFTRVAERAKDKPGEKRQHVSHVLAEASPRTKRNGRGCFQTGESTHEAKRNEILSTESS